MANIYYSEEQKVTNKWLWILISTVCIIYFYGLTEQLIFLKSVGTHPAPDWAMIIIGIIPLMLFYLLYKVRLNVKIDDQGVHYQFHPFHRKQRLIKWDEIKTVYIRKYRPIAEYGGWGIRTIYRNNVSYSVSGKNGLQLELKNKKKILLGTQNHEELNKIIENYKNLR
jgi:hypothetical protein